MVAWTFTWSTNASVLALLGGFIIGAVSVVRMYSLGKVTGISGIFGGFINIKSEFWNDDRLFRAVYTLAMVVGGIISSFVFEGCFEDWSEVPLYRLIIGGVLVGFGTTLGNGCTSGHGVCGLSSFRLRSLVATCTFMLAGALTATLSGTASYLPKFEKSVQHCQQVL